VDTIIKDAGVAAVADPGALATQTGPAAPNAATRPVLQAKGSCWYCEKGLDSVRRFCCRECADAFAEEAGFIR